ncbi:dihydrodipicolinate synthase family protein [Nitratireductor sp. GCM10026969]|uniref:dihydrodipicolinate synthase family protein n=1 Tax=Nitratireductor sp. GCM10026969 TaxID=3252645 RepID=UPI003614F53E
MKKLPKGVHTVLYALFGADGEPDRQAMRRQVDICVDRYGAAGIVTLGLATEVRHLTQQQRRRIVEWNAADIAGRVPLGVTIFEPTPEDQVSAIAYAADHGADWVIIQPPVTASDEAALATAFGTVLRQCPIPAAIQNAPQFIGVGLGVDAIRRLGDDHDNLIAVKQEVSAVETAALVGAVGERLQVFSGRGGLELIDCMHAGIEGHVPAPEYADFLISIWNAMAAGKENEARAGYARLLPMATFVVQSLDTLTTYGKLLFCRRNSLAFYPRRGAPAPTPFGFRALTGHAHMLGIDTAGWDPIG